MKYSDFLDKTELKTQVQAMNARAKADGKAGRLTVAGLRDRIYASGGKCEWCTVSLVGQDFEVDHIIPLQRGGENTADNIAVACPACNRRKSAKHPARFAQETVAQTGERTPLIVRVLTYYDAEATVQQSLFSDSPDDQPTLSIDSEDDNYEEDPPPYRWR
ncbi:MAG: HNH endonuclease signature motif containing protein [Chloroflexota bacterium]